jgi:alpha-beta hydrolase superfamily lysophospholipase
MKDEYKDLPIFLFGHSMGSFLSRIYALEYPESIDGIIIHGTGGKNPLLAMGKAVIKILKLFRGDRHRSKLVTALAFGSYNSTFPKEEGKNAWLTRDVASVAGRDSDPRTSFIFTLSAYGDLFFALGESNSARFYSDYPTSLPTLIMSGEEDPVGNYGKGPREVYDGLKKRGVYNLQLKMYEGARHELFNEINKAEVFEDIAKWLEALPVLGENG